jgi:ABC-2 type transport system permease protein
MNIFRQELKSLILSILIWSGSILMLAIAFMAVFPNFAGDTEALSKIMENYPKELLDAFGMSGVDLSTVAGYFSMTFLFIQLCAAVQASNYGFSILSIEQRERTSDFLYTRPVKRIRILTAKVLAVLSAIIITNLLIFPGSILVIEAFKDGRSYDKDIIYTMLTGMLFFQFVFLFAAMLISMLVRRVRNVLSYSIGFSFFMYILSVFESIRGIGAIAYITPFKQFEPGTVVINGGYDQTMLIIAAAMIVVSLTATCIVYIKRDIQSIS